MHPRESVPMLTALPPHLLSCTMSEEKAAITNSGFQAVRHGFALPKLQKLLKSKP